MSSLGRINVYVWTIVLTLAMLTLVYGCGPKERPVHFRQVGPYVVRTVPLVAVFPGSGLSYRRDIHGEFVVCATCHQSGGLGGGRFSLSGPGLPDAAADYLTTLPYIDQIQPPNSPLLRQAEGTVRHVTVWHSGDYSHSLVLKWIAKGATY